MGLMKLVRISADRKGIYETWKRRKEAYRKQYKSMTRQRLCVFSRLTEYGRQSAEVIN